MNAVFADSYYFFALLNPKDAAHEAAVRFSGREDAPLVTTSWILTELADGLARSMYRDAFATILEDLHSDSSSTVVFASEPHFAEGVEIYRRHGDKRWSLTDCISFVVMREYGLTDALTGDQHFVQAGFRALLIP